MRPVCILCCAFDCCEEIRRRGGRVQNSVRCACVAGPTTRDPGCVVHAFSLMCVSVSILVRVSLASLWIRLT